MKAILWMAAIGVVVGCASRPATTADTIPMENGSSGISSGSDVPTTSGLSGTGASSGSDIATSGTGLGSSTGTMGGTAGPTLSGDKPEAIGAGSDKRDTLGVSGAKRESIAGSDKRESIGAASDAVPGSTTDPLASSKRGTDAMGTTKPHAEIPMTGTEPGNTGSSSGLGSRTDTESATESKAAFVERVERRLETLEKAAKRVPRDENAEKRTAGTISPEERERFGENLKADIEKVRENLAHLEASQGEDWRSWRMRIQAQLDSMEDRFGDQLAE